MIVWKAHPKPVYAVAFSPDGRFLLTSGCDEVVRFWSLDRQEEIRQWPGSKFWSPIAFSPDGKFVARGGYGVHVWLAGKNNVPVISSASFAESLAFSPDGKVFVAHGEHGLARWSLPSGKVLPGCWGGTRESNDGNQFPTGAVAYHPGGKLLASCFGVLGKRAFDSVIYLWNAKSGERQSELRADYASAHPNAICFSPEGSLLAAIYGPILRIWDIKAEKEVAARQVGKKHFKGLAFTADGRRLVTVSNDETVRLWDTVSWSETTGFEWKIGKLGAVAVAPDGLRMAAGGSTGKVIIWNVDE